MGKAFIQEETLTSIANAIRQKNLSDIKYKPAEMPAAILALTSFSDEQKQTIIDALAEKGVYASIDELTLDNIATYILQIKIDSNREEFFSLRKNYNELIEYAQNQLNVFNNTQLSINFYPELDETKDVVTQLAELTEKFNELKTYLIDELGGV